MGNEVEETEENIDVFGKLPETLRNKFLQQVFARTSRADGCRLSLMSKSFKSAADSDVAWERFMPYGYKQVPENFLNLCGTSPSKELYMFLYNYPHDYNGGWVGDLNYWFDKWSGKRCIMIPNNMLSCTYLPTNYWKNKKSLVLGHVVWLEIHEKISTSKLFPGTTYTIYLTYVLSKRFYYGLHLPIEASIRISGEEKVKQIVYLDPRIAKSHSDGCKYPKHTKYNDFLEVELGDYHYLDNLEEENKMDLEISVMEVKSRRPKCGAKFSWIEIRPKRIR